MRRLWIWNVVIAVVIIALAIGVGNYVYQRVTYISTNNARVAASMVTIAALATGQLTDWSVKTGDRVLANEVIGSEVSSGAGPTRTTGLTGRTPVASGLRHGRGGNVGTAGAQLVRQQAAPTTVQTTQSLVAPTNGTVLMTNVVPNEVVTQGQPLAVIADLSKLYVMAYIDEGQVRNVSPGQTVDVYLDAYPGSRFDGTVQTVGNVAGNVLSPLAGMTQTTGSSVVTQRVPVNISVDLLGKYVVPGLSASIRIHR